MAALHSLARLGLPTALLQLIFICFALCVPSLARDTLQSNDYSTLSVPCNELTSFAQQQGWQQVSVPKTGERQFLQWVYNGSDIVSTAIAAGAWEQDEIKQLDWAFSQYNTASQSGVTPVFVDIGANVGWFTLNMAFRNRTVYAFEAMPTNARLIGASLCANPSLAARVSLFNHGLGPAPDRCWMFSSNVNVGNGVTLCGVATEEAARARMEPNSELRGSISIARMDDILLPRFAQQQGPPPAIVAKVDIEGYEYAAFQGAAGVLSRGHVHYMLMEFSMMVAHRSGKHAPLHLLQYLSGLGFAISKHGFSGPFIPASRLHLLPRSVAHTIISLFLVHRNAPTYGSIEYISHTSQPTTLADTCDSLTANAKQQGWQHVTVPKTGERQFSMWVYNGSDVVSTAVASGSWEHDEIQQLDWAFSQYNTASQSGVTPVFVDIGANIGWFSMNMAFRNRTVYAFEAMPTNARLIGASLCANPSLAARVSLYNTGLGPAPDRCWMFSSNVNVGNGVTLCGVATEEAARARSEPNSQLRGMISIARLDDVLLPKFAQQQGNTPPAIVVKIDIEGYEYSALQGASGVLSRGYVHYMLMEFSLMVVHRSGNPEAPMQLLNYITRVGFAISTKGFAGPFTPASRLADLMPEAVGRDIYTLFLVHRSAPTYANITYV